ncbi:MAG: hypothetical protein WKF74_14940 [Pyrinomonadaceae bacterium]
MANLRSPNYPQETLAQACDRIRRVYDIEHTHPTPKEVVAKALGYNSINGASLAVLGTLRRYALLIQDGENLRVSDDAVTIIELEENHEDRAEALRRCAFAPKLFGELRDKFPDKLPSDTSLRHFLIQQKKFLPKAADEVIRVYRANLELVTTEAEAYNDGGTNDSKTEGASRMPPTAQQQPPANQGSNASIIEPPKGMHFPLYLSKEKQAALYIPFALSKREFDLLKKQLDHTMMIAKETALEDDSPQSLPLPDDDSETLSLT